jgi:FtsZ-binding cell division protein ZapB
MESLTSIELLIENNKRLEQKYLKVEEENDKLRKENKKLKEECQSIRLLLKLDNRL